MFFNVSVLIKSPVTKHIIGMAANCKGKWKLYPKCFTMNFMETFRIDVLQNSSGWVLLDIKSLTMFARLKAVWPSVTALFIPQSDIRSAHHQRLMASVYTCVKIENCRKLCADQ